MAFVNVVALKAFPSCPVFIKFDAIAMLSWLKEFGRNLSVCVFPNNLNNPKAFCSLSALSPSDINLGDHLKLEYLKVVTLKIRQLLFSYFEFSFLLLFAISSLTD